LEGFDRHDAAIGREFNLVRHEWQFPPSFNVAPTQDDRRNRPG
jgi:hypothetical protein